MSAILQGGLYGSVQALNFYIQQTSVVFKIADTIVKKELRIITSTISEIIGNEFTISTKKRFIANEKQLFIRHIKVFIRSF